MASLLESEVETPSKTDIIARRVETGPDGEITVLAPAKVNLFLHVTGQREDGYHLLESLFVFTEKGDCLRFGKSDSLNLKVSGSFAENTPDDESNLVMKAAVRLAEKFGVRTGASIVLEKNLPVASGIGGGSSNAAAALIGLTHLWGLPATQDDLLKIALQLGADVPACLAARPVMVTGIGEELTPTPMKWRTGILLVNPGRAVSTAEVFRGLKAHRSSIGKPIFDEPLASAEVVAGSIENLRDMTGNSLADPARALCSDIGAVEQLLHEMEQPQLVRMSGSGATVFALYPNKEAAENAAVLVKKSMPCWWVMADEIGE